MNVGPARSICMTRRSYHQTAPHLSPCSCGAGTPINSMGEANITGKKRQKRYANLPAVMRGSRMVFLRSSPNLLSSDLSAS
jgi:hypothetical protein